MKRPTRALWLVLAGIALRAVVPAGYMPAPLAEGLPFVLCPGAVPGVASLSAGHGPQDGGHDHEDEEAAAGDPGRWVFCPFGAVIGASVLPAEIGPIAAWLEAVTPAAPADPFVPSPSMRAWRARAPPTDLSIDA